MGCTPSKNPVSDSSEKQVDFTIDESYRARKISDDNKVSSSPTNGTNGRAQHTGNGRNGQVNLPCNGNNPKRFTQSQLDFFKMLDNKIDAGPDYAPTAEEDEGR